MAVAKRIYVLDGRNMTSLARFYDEVDRVMQLADWGHNLDAFNDILRGGFGTPEGGFVLKITHSARARSSIGSLFDVLLDIIKIHGEGGEEAVDGVELVLA
jgi:RNAse (barnase) inhibitor barstar